MEALPLPQHVTSETISPNHARITIEPCYPGYGTTLGNALRRVLLSSLPGAAVTAVKITGVDHEFSTLPGVKEDVVDFLLNVKQLRLKSHSAEPVRVSLKVSGEREVTAGDITGTSEVEVMNTDLHLATLTDKKASLEVEFVVEQGRGYVPVETHEKEKLEIGTIAVDALFSSVSRVGYTVENVRVGQMTNFDKLSLDVETDGSLSPLEAVKYASKLLIDHFAVVAGQTVPEASEQVSESGEAESSDEAPEVKPAKKRGRPKKE
jgi:DNA-directed RNA polymerase subunit alpha